MKENKNNKINQYNSEVNPDDIWAAIEPRVDELNAKKKRKRRGLFFLLAGLGIAALLAIWFYQIDAIDETLQRVAEVHENVKNEKNQQQQVSTNETNQKIDDGTVLKKEKKAARVDENKKQITQDETNNRAKEKDNIKNSENKSSPISAGQSSTNKSTIKSTQINSTSSHETLSNAGRQQQSNKRINESETTSITQKSQRDIEDENDLITGSVRQNQSSHVESELPGKLYNDESELNTKTSNKSEMQLPKTTQVIESEDDVVSSHETVRNANLFNTAQNETSIKRLNHLRSVVLLLPESEINYTPLFVQERKTQQGQQKKNFSMVIGASGGASVPNRKMTTSNGGSSIYKQLRETTESQLEAIHYGVDLMLEHKSGFNLSIGYHQTDINEQFDASNIVSDTTWINVVKFLVINLTDDTVQVYGEIPVTDVTNTTYEVYNRYRLAEIPIIVGYSHHWNHWRIGLQAGVLVNLSLTTKGRIFNEQLDVINLSNDGKMYKNQIGLGYQFGITIQRPIVGRLSLRLAPTVKFYPNLMQDNQPLSSKHTLVGGNLGLVYRFD